LQPFILGSSLKSTKSFIPLSLVHISKEPLSSGYNLRILNQKSRSGMSHATTHVWESADIYLP